MMKRGQYSVFRIGAFATFVLFGLVGGWSVTFHGLIPALAKTWAWNPSGIVLVVSFVVSVLLYTLGSWLKEKADAKENQATTGDTDERE